MCLGGSHSFELHLQTFGEKVNEHISQTLLYQVVADQQRCFPPGAAEHVHVGALPDSTSHSVGARPHHLTQTTDTCFLFICTQVKAHTFTEVSANLKTQLLGCFKPRNMHFNPPKQESSV